jgi:hypothetical protein
MGAAAERGGRGARWGREPWRERVLTPLGLWFPSNAAREGWATLKLVWIVLGPPLIPK